VKQYWHRLTNHSNFFQKSQIKNIYAFYITLITFYYYLNNKSIKKHNFFPFLLNFFFKVFHTLYHINNFLLLFKQKFHYQNVYQIYPLVSFTSKFNCLVINEVSAMWIATFIIKIRRNFTKPIRTFTAFAISS
jgi:hypothetical protein